MRGEILGIAGGSGSGKSVLLKTLVGPAPAGRGQGAPERKADRGSVGAPSGRR